MFSTCYRDRPSHQECRRPPKLEAKGSKVGHETSLFSNRVVEAWNLIPSTVKNARTVSAFKQAYKKLRAEMLTPT
jgi:hypothetical protein